MSPVLSAAADVRLGHAFAEMHAHLERRLGLQRDLFSRWLERVESPSHSPWNVRLITSICCSRVSRTKFTA